MTRIAMLQRALQRAITESHQSTAMSPVFCSCGELYRLLSASGHPCAREAGHAADQLGHVCCCEAEQRLETQMPSSAGGAA